MPWCPKCKLEYQEGITVCSDCGAELVAQFEEIKEPPVIIMSTSEPDLANRFLAFLSYSHITSGNTGFSQETEEYEVSVAESDSQEAKKLFRTFYIQEQEELQKQKKAQVREATYVPRSEDKEDEASEQEEPLLHLPEQEQAKANAARLRNEAAHVYVRKKDKYEDLSSTANMFFFFGILGLSFVAANVAGIIHFISGILPFTTYSVLFIGCIAVGITTRKRAKNIQSQIADEDSLTDEINRWMEGQIKKELLEKLTDPALSNEINYMNQTAKIKEMLKAEFPDAEDAMADEMIEEFYHTHFES